MDFAYFLSPNTTPNVKASIKTTKNTTPTGMLDKAQEIVKVLHIDQSRIDQVGEVPRLMPDRSVGLGALFLGPHDGFRLVVHEMRASKRVDQGEFVLRPGNWQHGATVD